MSVRWGIAGTGRIAVAMVEGIRDAGGEVDVVSSSDPDRAAAFAAEHGIPTSVSPHLQITDTAVDAVYVATTNQLHHDQTITFLEAGKAVLCEKPIALDLAQATEMVETAQRTGTFLMEAMWMVFQPYWEVVDRWLEQIGDVRWIQSDFGFPADFLPDDRLLDPAAGGGSLLDVGIYPLTLIHRLLGVPDEISAVAALSDRGVDHQMAAVLQYESGAIAVAGSSIVADTPLEAVVAGPNGRIRVHSPFHASQRVSLRQEGDEILSANAAYRGSGYRFEVEEVHRCLEEGLIESPLRPWKDTLEVMGMIDEIRTQIGVEFG